MTEQELREATQLIVQSQGEQEIVATALSAINQELLDTQSKLTAQVTAFNTLQEENKQLRAANLTLLLNRTSAIVPNNQETPQNPSSEQPAEPEKKPGHITYAELFGEGVI